jgi:hypothetical protein
MLQLNDTMERRKYRVVVLHHRPNVADPVLAE